MNATKRSLVVACALLLAACAAPMPGHQDQEAAAAPRVVYPPVKERTRELCEPYGCALIPMEVWNVAVEALIETGVISPDFK